MIGYYDNPTPDVDVRWERISENVDELSIEDLAYELENYDLVGKCHTIIFDTELPLPRLYLVEDLVLNSDFTKLLGFIQPETLDKIKELLVEKLYWRDDE